MSNEVWINMQTAPRGDVESVFLNQRDILLKRIIRLSIELDSANENRFKDDPIELELSFGQQVRFFKMKPVAEQIEIGNKFLEELDAIDNPPTGAPFLGSATATGGGDK